MQHVFGEHIGPTFEAYVDDIIVKSKRVNNLVDDLDIAFKCLKAKNIKLNPEKCVFGVSRGMLLGRDENDRKRSIGGQITFVFTSFSQKQNRYDIVRNEYGADILVISKMIVVDRKIHR
jgi:hypothetical protein